VSRQHSVPEHRFRYLFGIAAVASALVVRIWLIPLTPASFHSLVFAVDGIVVIYLTFPHEEGDPVTPTLQQAGARV
jgi:hypothetical protein